MKKLTGERSRWFSSSFSFRFLVGLLLGGGVVSPPPLRFAIDVIDGQTVKKHPCNDL